MLRTALPVIFTYLGLMTMTLVDLICVGRVGATATGAVGLGTAVFNWFMIFGIGLVSGLEYLVSHSIGASGTDEAGRAAGRRTAHSYYSQSVMATVLLGVPLTAVLFAVAEVLPRFGFEPEVTALTIPYLKILAFSLIPVHLFTAGRLYLLAHGSTIPALLVLAAANLLNLILNLALVLGQWGFPRLGSTGSAWATLISRVAMLAALWAWIHWTERHERFRLHWDGARLRELLRLGLPSAFQMTFEVGVFAFATTLVAKLGAVEQAAHQITLNIASLTFMVPLGTGSATAVLVGARLGAGDGPGARRTGWHGFRLGMGFMALSCAVLLLVPGAILRAYTTDSAVIELATRVIFIAALFQLSDGAQVVATGALRGLGETRIPMLANLIGHWAFGLPLGAYLCYLRGWGILGIWTGLSAGLTVVAIALLWTWNRRSGEVAAPLRFE